MKDLRDIDGIEFGRWSPQRPGREKSYMVRNSTYDKILSYMSDGYRIIVGNNHRRRFGVRLSHVNSMIHGKTIRTIWAVKWRFNETKKTEAL